MKASFSLPFSLAHHDSLWLIAMSSHWLGSSLLSSHNHISFHTSPFRALTDLVSKGGMMASAVFGGSFAATMGSSNVVVAPGAFWGG